MLLLSQKVSKSGKTETYSIFEQWRLLGCYATWLFKNRCFRGT
jgi:lipid-A-disaccharide synthase-like uncharacterized protein